MIRPRYTPYQTAVRLDEQFLHVAGRTPRPLAHCALCGARLSQYRYPGETRCAPCITRHTATIPPEELHPTIIPREMHYECPNCGGPKYRTAELCRGCDKVRRAGR